MKNKLVMISIVILVAITLLGGLSFYIYKTYVASDEESTASAHAEEKEKPRKKPKDERPIAEIVACCLVDSGEITTNLATPGSFTKIQFNFQTDTEEAKVELEERLFEVKNIILKKLAETQSDQLMSPDQIAKLEEGLTEKINEILHEGYVDRTIVVHKIVQ